MQFIHVGLASSHFTRRLRHVRQPVLDLVLRTASGLPFGFVLEDEGDDEDDWGDSLSGIEYKGRVCVSFFSSEVFVFVDNREGSVSVLVVSLIRRQC